ncbi:hypothetical protein CEQ90_19550 [Lewinellaceae bacterium SD302]|nr:hypothetical protein CEQ90_19550 [Lewinellaceae bacterium SD302]
MPILDKEHWFAKRKPLISIDIYWRDLKDKSVSNIKKLLVKDINTGSSNFIEGGQYIRRSVIPVVFYDSVDKSVAQTMYQSKEHGMVKVLTVKGLPVKEQAYEEKSVTMRVQAVPFTENQKGKLSDQQQPDKFEDQVVQLLRIPYQAVEEFDIQAIAQKLSEGYKVIFEKRRAGKLRIRYVKRVIQSKRYPPRIYLKFELMLCSYLGNYGAGETINVTSLFPGERTTISMRTYKNSASTRSRAESIIDSISESSINSFESALQEQSGQSSDSSSSSSVTNPGEVFTGGTGLIPSLFGSASATVQTPSTGSATQSHISNMSSQVSSAVTQTVNESNHFRDVSINNTSVEQSEFGEETAIIREFENINRSRTLNFVFRRLLQNYITVLWLKNIKFGIVYGDADNHKGEEVQIYQLQDFINTHIVSEFREEAFQDLIKRTMFIFNHRQQPIQFFECNKFKTPQVDCDCSNVAIPEDEFCLWVKNSQLEDSVDNITVPGVIMNVSKHVMRTPGVIVDSLLGQGEALDCYNTNLQQQNIIAAELNNERTKQALNIIDGFSTPEEQAVNYKRVFGECCEKENE